MKPGSLAPVVIAGLSLLSLSAVSTVWAEHCLAPIAMPMITAPTKMAGEHAYSPRANKQAAENRVWRTVRVFEDKGNAVTPPFAVSGTAWSLSWEIERITGTSANFNIHIFRRDKPYALWQTISCADGNKGEKTFSIESENSEEFFLKIFASNLIRWTIRVQDNFPVAPRSAVEISHIHYRGTHYVRDTESCICYEVVEPDEYVAIINSGERAQRMGGWILKNITKGYPTFIFPADFVLHPNQTVIVTTNEVYPDCKAWMEFGTRSPYCAKPLWFSFYFGPGDIWDNRRANTAVLYDSNGNEVSRKSYAVIGE